MLKPHQQNFNDIDLLHSPLHMLPIWVLKETVVSCKTILYSFKVNTQLQGLNCTELFIEMPTTYRSQFETFLIYKHQNIKKYLLESLQMVPLHMSAI